MMIISIIMPLVLVRFAFKVSFLSQRYNILTDTPKSSVKSFNLQFVIFDVFILTLSFEEI